jgi:AraC family transcriptional activator of tynA and feaB
MADGEDLQQQRAGSPSIAQTHVDIWSTNTARAHERFSYWRDAVCEAVFGISIEAPPERFSARIAARSSGALRFAISESTGYEIVRSPRDIAREPADHYSIYLQLSGRTVSRLDEHEVAFKANDIGIYDGRKTFRAMHSGRRAIAVIPRAMIDQRAPWLRRRPPRKLANSPFLKLARRHLLQLTAADTTLSEIEVGLLTENLCNLMALASADNTESARLQPDLQLQAMLAFCRQHLNDSELSPQRVADQFRLSVRTVHSRFRQMGQSFGRWLLESRLDACGAALRDSNQRGSNISEIAYNLGFNDLSHFNKAFRARFDMTPREWRNEIEMN